MKFDNGRGHGKKGLVFFGSGGNTVRENFEGTRNRVTEEREESYVM